MLREIRIHGRGGQGSVTAAVLIAEGCFCTGLYAQAFPAFGVERRGAPVAAFVRISNNPIRLRQQIYKPNFIIIQDITLIGAADVLLGADPDTLVLINTSRTEKEIFDLFSKKCAVSGNKKFAIPCNIDMIKTVPATEIAMEIIGRPIVNTIMLGAFAGLTGLISIEAMSKAITGMFPPEIAEPNIKAAKTAFEHSSPHHEFLYLPVPKSSIALEAGERLAIEA